ncbi:MAG: tetratricopeptide repeat protein [Chloroflexota bacterium]
MKTFSELLSEYIVRLGISDAELARTIGVRRQTIFRWREGLTARPRHRDDVMRLSEKLRLTPEERDTLLLAAGFSPQSADLVSEAPVEDVEAKPPSRISISQSAVAPTSAIEMSQVDTNKSQPNQVVAPPEQPPQVVTPSLFSPRIVGSIIGGLALLVMIGWVLNPFAKLDPDERSRNGGLANVLTATVVQEPTDTPTPTPSPTQPASLAIPTAGAGETVILITHFKNYAGVGYNVRDRLQVALQEEIEAANINNVRVEAWEEEIGQRRFAVQAGQAVSATLIIFGEYDAGRVVAQFANPSAEQELKDDGWIQEVDDMKGLSAAINQELPEQIRPLSLLILGQIYIGKEQFDPARLILDQARDTVKNDDQTDDDTKATIDLYRGLAYGSGKSPLYDKAITAYTDALKTNPDFRLAQFNRSRMYHARQLPGDLQKALDDIDTVIEKYANGAGAYNNRAAILLDMGDLEQAKSDLDRALNRDPDLVSALLNQAVIAYIEGEPFSTWQPNLERALELNPTHAKTLNMMCWGYGITEQAELGFPFCEAAVEQDPSPVIRDSRGLVHGLLGNVDEAVADFEVYIDWLLERDRVKQAEERRQWIDALTDGDDPFTSDVMTALRNEK